MFSAVANFQNQDIFVEPVFPGSITINGTNILCNGAFTGAISLTISSTYSPLSYLWNIGNTQQDLAGLAAGNYECVITIDATGETFSTGIITLTQPTPIIATVSSTNQSSPGANDGTATVIVSGGTPAYSYTWFGPGGIVGSNATITNLIPGTYYVEIMDANGCNNFPPSIVIT